MARKAAKTNEEVIKEATEGLGKHDPAKGGSQPVGERPKVQLSSKTSGTPVAATPEASVPENVDLTKTYIIIDVFSGKDPMNLSAEDYIVRVSGIKDKVQLQQELSVLPPEEVGLKKRLIAVVAKETVIGVPKGDNVDGTPIPPQEV